MYSDRCKELNYILKELAIHLSFRAKGRGIGGEGRGEKLKV